MLSDLQRALRASTNAVSVPSRLSRLHPIFHKRIRFALALAVSLVFAPRALSQSVPSGNSPIAPAALNRRDLGAVRLSRPPVIDGDLSDSVWAEAARADRFTDQITNKEPDDQTVALIGYDEKNIYVAIHAYDREPGGIVGRQTKRGVPFEGEDRVTLSIDLYASGAYHDLSSFSVNALGVEYAQLAGGRGSKLEWEGRWRAAAKIVPDGWTAEMAIPWAILNYPLAKGPRDAGLNFDRFQERTKVDSWWSNIGPNELYDLEGRWKGVEFPAFQPSFSYLPYATVGWKDDQAEGKIGLDVRSALTPSLTLVGTAKPDFENVEGAVEGIDFSYSERYVADYRPFFLEGSNIYGSGGVPGSYYYSQRIPDFDAGVNLYGKATPKDTIGVLTAVKFGDWADWILRGWHAFSPTATMDMALINRDATDSSNRVLVMGENYRKGNWHFDAAGANSWAGGKSTGGAGNAALSFQTPRWDAEIEPHFVNANFRDDLGYIPFTDFRGVNSDVTYANEWRTGAFRSVKAYVSASNSDRYDGDIFHRQKEASVQFATRSDYAISAGWSGGRFEDYDDTVFNVAIQARSSDAFHTYGLGYQQGYQGGGDIKYATPFATWKFGNKLTLGVSSAILRHIENQEQDIYTFNYDFSPGEGIGGRVVSQTGGTGGYLSYRRSGYGGVETWVILGDPNSKKFENRFTTKVVWPF